MARFVAPIPHSGLLVRGNIDIDARKVPLTFNKDGTISSVETSSFGVDSQEDTGKIQIPAGIRAKHKGFEICYPQVISKGGKWQRVSQSAGEQWARRTGRHLGVFDNVPHAESYAQGLHNYLAKFTNAWLRKHHRRG